VQARREPATPSAFEGDGFEMYVRPPVSQPGAWRLQVELELDGKHARGVAVPVPCLAEPGEAVGLARERLDGEGPARELARGLLATARSGARLPAGLAPAETLELLHDPRGARPGPRPRPLELGFRDRDGRERWTWGWMPVEPPHAVLVLLVPSHQPPQVVLEGVLGPRWRATAKDLSALLLSASLPRAATDAEELAACLERLHALAVELVGEVPVVLVARGDALEAVQRGLASTSAPFAALIGVTPRGGPPAAASAGPPSLLVAADGPAEVTALEGSTWWVGGEREVLLDDPLLPALATGWLPSRLSQGPTPTDKR